MLVYAGKRTVEREKGGGTEVLAGIVLSGCVCKFGRIVLGFVYSGPRAGAFAPDQNGQEVRTSGESICCRS